MASTKETREVGRGIMIRRAASMLAHGKDYKGFIRNQTQFTAGDRADAERRAERLGHRLEAKTPQAPVPPGGKR